MATEPRGILVPAYDRPGDLSDWDPAFAAAGYLSPRRLIVIANPDNGPGSPDPAYVAAIDKVIRRCGMVVGYVHDCYNGDFPEDDPPSNCPRATLIEQDMARWFTAYPRVSGIFVDQVKRGDANRAGDLKDMVVDAYAKRWPGSERGPVIVLNPGSIPSTTFMYKTDPAIVVIQEQTFDYFRSWPPSGAPGWVQDREAGALSGIPARRLAIIAHTPQNPQNATADVAMLVDVAQRYSIGSVYANHLVGSNYKPLSTSLVPLAQRICQLHTKFGLPCRIFTAPVCLGSQVLARVRSGDRNAFARR
jgi:hypothetical protein